MSLTAEGWCLAAVMLLIGLAALNTGAPLLYVMFSMMCSFFVLSAMMAGNTMRGLSVSRELPKVWQAGRPLSVKMTVTNGKLLTRSHGLRVLDRISADRPLGGAFFQSIPPRREPVTEAYECLFPKRGRYNPSRVDVATRFPFGLIERVLSIRTPGEILILPQTINLDRRLSERRSDFGDLESHRKGPGSGLYGLREYTADMSARDIHWRTSARRGELMVREYEAEERRQASVILDNRVPAALQSQQFMDFELAVILTASVIEWFCQQDFEVELRTASGIVGFGTGSSHFLRCQRVLAELEMVDPSALGNAPADRPSEQRVVRIPITIQGPRPASGPGTIPLSVEDLREELFEAMRPDPAPAASASPSREGGGA